MDSQAPALNFPIGSLNGPSELDIESIELIPGTERKAWPVPYYEALFQEKGFTFQKFGVEEGKSTRFELGFNASFYAKANLMENVSMENTLNLYSNYLEDPQNMDLDYTMNIVMTINKYLSTNLIFQTIYDDNAYEGFQVREVLGLGINYAF